MIGARKEKADVSACCPSKLSNFLKVFCCMQTGTLLSSATVACQAALVQTASAGRRCSWGHPCPPESYPAHLKATLPCPPQFTS